MKKPKFLLWIIIAVTIFSIIAVPKLLPKKGAENAMRQTSGRTAPQTAPVSAVIVSSRPFQQTITVPGSVLANEQVLLKAEASGRIVKLSLREGANAKKGDLLVKINDADLQAQLEKAQATLKLAQDREKRQRSLLEKSLISQEEHDISQAGLTAGIADIDLYKALIAKTEIRAPFDGRVGLKLVSEGAFLSIGSPVADFVKVLPLKIEFSVPERYAAAVAPGSDLTFTVHGSTVSHKAKVFAHQPAIDEATRTLRVRALCNEAGNGVLPGAFAEVRLSIGAGAGTFMIPTQAVVPDMQGQNLFLIQDGKAKKQLVETGDRTGTEVQITKGLKQGDTVITSGVLMLRPGAAVTINRLDSQVSATETSGRRKP